MMKFSKLPDGTILVRFTMHGKRRLWAGTKRLRLAIAIGREYSRELRLA